MKFCRLIALLTGFILLLSSCSRIQTRRRFDEIANAVRNSYLAFNPVKATLIGEYTYNNMLDSRDSDAIQTRINALKAYQQQLANLDSSLLDSIQGIDYSILTRAVQQELWELDKIKSWQNNPCVYSRTIYDAFYGILRNDNLPVDVRCDYLLSRLKLLPRFLETAQQQLKAANKIQLAESDAELAALQVMMSDGIHQLAMKSTGFQDSLAAAIRVSLNAVTFFRTWLREYADSLSQPTRINREQYKTILRNRYAVDWDIDRLIKLFSKEDSIAQHHIDDLLEDVYYTFYRRRRNHPDRDDMLERVLQRIFNQYVQNDLLLETSQDVWLNIRQFLDVKAIFPLEGLDNITITRSRPWERNIEPVWLVSTGALNRPRQYKLIIKSIPTGQNWYGQIAFLRLLNRTSLHVILASQLVPGRLFIEQQLQQHPSKIRHTFADQGLRLGWPLMALNIMSEAGYEGYSSKFQFGTLLNERRVFVRALADIKYHAEGYTSKNLKAWMVEHAFLSEQQAQQYMDDIVLNPGKYVIPAWGYLFIKQLYQQAQAKESNRFSRAKFFKQLTSEGPIPLGLINNRFLYENRKANQFQ